MDRQFPCIESTVDIQHSSGLTVRLWINQISVLPDLLEEAQLVESIVQLLDVWTVSATGRKKLFMLLADIPAINAAQVIEAGYVEGESTIRLGRVIYTVPFEDVHG